MHIQSENEARCNVKTFDGLQAQPISFAEATPIVMLQCRENDCARRTLWFVLEFDLCDRQICVVLPLVILNFSTNAVLRTDVTWHQHQSQATAFREPAHRQTAFRARRVEIHHASQIGIWFSDT